VNWVLDADIRDFFGQLDHAWLRRFLGHRIADKRVLRLIDKWLAAGVIEDGNWSATEEGSPQGASVSPLLANVYLHYVLDLWADWWRRRHAHGDVIIVRWADDFIVGFEHEKGRAAVPGRASRAAGEVRAGTASGQDPADRVRAVRRRAATGAGSG
jgi:retron-type reverse transcriptase